MEEESQEVEPEGSQRRSTKRRLKNNSRFNDYVIEEEEEPIEVEEPIEIVSIVSEIEDPISNTMEVLIKELSAKVVKQHLMNLRFKVEGKSEFSEEFSC